MRQISKIRMMNKTKRRIYLMFKVNLDIKVANGLLHLTQQQWKGDQIISSAVCQLVVDLT